MSATPPERESDAASESSRWYVMLFPSAAETATIAAMFQRLATRVGGTANPTPHVTVGYFYGNSSPDAVIDRVRLLIGPAIRIHAGGLFSWSEEPHPLFGHTLSLRVRRDRPLQDWQRAVRIALAPTGLVPVFTWEHQWPHMNALRHMPLSPLEALRLLADRNHALTWVAAHLLVSQQVGSDFVTWLVQPLLSGSGDTAQ
jgi:hypothetical protein